MSFHMARWGWVFLCPLALVRLVANCSSDETDQGEDSGLHAQDATADGTSVVGDSSKNDGPSDVQDGDVKADVKTQPDVGSDADSGDSGKAVDASDDAEVVIGDAEAGIVDADVTTDARVDSAPDGGGCLDPTNMQVISSTMYGCPGTVLWINRDTLCASGCSACTSSAWAALNGSVLPTHHYWTDDRLGWSGSDTHQCGAVLDGGNGCDLPGAPPSPMHVCVPVDSGASTDPEGNGCIRSGCGYNNNTPDAPDLYFGGCFLNATAGTLCCCR